MKNYSIDQFLSSSMMWLLLTAIITIILILDGIIPDLPSYDLRTQNSTVTYLFFSLVIIASAVSQLVYLEVIRRKYFHSVARKYSKKTHFIVAIIQYLIIALTLSVLIQIGILKEYNTFIVGFSALLSLLLSTSVATLLAYRFLAWLKYDHDIVIAAYAAATIMIAANSLVFATSISFEMQNARSIIDSTRFAVSMMNVTSFELKEVESNLAMVSFVAIWLASTFLLRRSRAKWGAIKFYSIVLLPLLYYFGVFQLFFSQILLQYDILNALQSYTFNIVNSSLTRPVGGILFGIAFWAVARSIENKEVSDYMKLSSFGIVLLSIAGEDTGLFLLNYPPFGLSSITFIGISSYLLFVGVYYSAISVSLNQKLRSSIQKSVEQQLSFVSKIGASQVEQEIQQRVKYLTRKVAKKLEEESGVSVPMDSEEIDRYIKFVIEEKETFSSKKNEFSDNEVSSS